MRIIVIVCANGRGHRVRCERVMRRLAARRPEVDVTFVEERAVRWSSDATVYDDGELARWHERAARMEILDEADLVVSDNLPAVLRRRPDAILMGSFLWSDVLLQAHPASAAVREFAALDDELLDQHRPPMICVDALAMPAVRTRTNALAVGFMVEGPPLSDRPRHGVGVLGGATGAADALLDAAVTGLKSTGVEVCRGDEAAAKLGFLDAVVCRPGTGTITDCVGACVPMVALAEANPEMRWNARRLEALGVGRLVNDARSVTEAVSALIKAGDDVRRKLAALPRNGLDEAASLLEERLMA